MSTIRLNVRVYIQRAAFESLEMAVEVTAPRGPAKAANGKSSPLQAKKEKAESKKGQVIDEAKDTESERLLKERKVAINCLFDKLKMQPVYSDAKLKKHKKKGKLDSKHAILDHYNGKAEKNLLKGSKSGKSKDKGKGKGKAVDEDEEEESGTEMSGEQVNTVFETATRNDLYLPEMEPSKHFTLQLR